MSPSRMKMRDSFPAGSEVKNPPAKAGDMGSISVRLRKIPHAAEQLSLCTTTIKLVL